MQVKPELTIDTREAQPMTLASAILIYKGGRTFDNSERVHATLHDVAHVDGGTPALLPGVTADKPAIAKLLARLGESLSFTGFIPHRLLFVGPDALVWWTEPGLRQVWFQGGKVGTRSAVTPHPGLVFAVAGGRWYVWAVKGKQRPDVQVELFRAPYFNVWENGKICEGNVELPRSFGIETIDGYEQAFFSSNFTHANVHGKGKLTTHRGGPTGLWKALLDGKYKTFPTATLVAAANPQTLGELPGYLNNHKI